MLGWVVLGLGWLVLGYRWVVLGVLLLLLLMLLRLMIMPRLRSLPLPPLHHRHIHHPTLIDILIHRLHRGFVRFGLELDTCTGDHVVGGTLVLGRDGFVAAGVGGFGVSEHGGLFNGRRGWERDGGGLVGLVLLG